MLTSLWIENLKSFGPRQEIPLQPLTLFIGPNGAGKSTILQALDLLRQYARPGTSSRGAWPYEDLAHRGKSIAIGVRAGGGALDFRVTGAQWQVTTLAAGQLRDCLASYRILAPDLAALAAPRLVQPITAVPPDGTDAASMVDHLRDFYPERYEALNEDLRRCVPGVREVVAIAARGQPGHKALFIVEESAKVPLVHASDGIKFLLFVLLLVHSEPKPQIVGLEEPERHVHPRLLGEILGYLRGITRGPQPSQVLLTTHSPLVLDHFRDSAEEVIAVERQDGVSQCHPLEQRLAELRSAGANLHDSALGDLWYSGVLGAVPAP